jgi:hypothetical protein
MRCLFAPPSNRSRFWVCLLAFWLAFAGNRVAAEEGAEPFWKQAVWYVPNRALDLVDVFRVRAKVGPGVGAGVRMTDALSLYAGRSHAAYLGLPGPRGGMGLRPLWGWEQMRGGILLGLDVTDDLPYAPVYESSEIGFSAHLLLVGGEVTFSPNEWVDFLGGWFGLDPAQDDLPRKPVLLPASFPRPVLGPILVEPAFPLAPKPETFSGLADRLDYLSVNAPLQMRSQLYAFDSWLVGEREAEHMQPPVQDFRVTMEYQWVGGSDPQQRLRPELDLDIELPNIEGHMALFILSSYDDDLPGLDRSQRNDKGWSVGLRKQFEAWNISGDVGIHTKWFPELFAKVSWDPTWEVEDWNMGFQQRIFWENEDGFGVLSSLQGDRWLQKGRSGIGSLTAVRFSEATRGAEWQHSWRWIRLRSPVDPDGHRRMPGPRDSIACSGLKVSVFGNDRELGEYRAQWLLRRPIHGNFVVLEIEPGVQWRNDQDWEMQPRLDMALQLVF